jgi:hypothetical protein
MVQRVEILLTDDLDGSEIRTGKGETVPFALDGRSYEPAADLVDPFHRDWI